MLPDNQIVMHESCSTRGAGQYKTFIATHPHVHVPEEAHPPLKMNCLPYHQTVHPAGFRVHPFDVFDDMFNLTRRPSSCHGAYLDEQRAMETRRREPKTRQQQPARRAKLPTRERAEPFQVSVVEDSDDALVVSIRILGTYPKHSQLKIAPNGRTSLRVSMTACDPYTSVCRTCGAVCVWFRRG